jgi:hypothetical protein
MNTESLVYRLRKRAEIRRQIASRKSVQEGKPDRIADLLDEAAAALELAYANNNDSRENPSEEFLAKLTESTVGTSIRDIESGRVKILSSVSDDLDLPETDLPKPC